MAKRQLNARFKYVGPRGQYAVLLEPDKQLIGFIEWDKRDWSWIHGPRWHIRTKEGDELVNLPATRDGASRWLWNTVK